jgi:DNA polymerase III sliding clamp (beta) subunit (PCNA family)
MTVTSITATVGELDRILKHLKPADPGRVSSLPSLPCVQFTLAEHGVSARMTDLELSITVAVGAASTGEAGSTLLVSAAELRRFLKPFASQDEVTVVDVATGKGDLGKVRLECAGIALTIWQPDRDEYPGRPTPADGASTVRLDFQAARHVLAAASRDDNRPILTGIFIDGDQYAATDSYRLHICQSPTDSGADKLLVPARLFTALDRWRGVHDVTVDDHRLYVEAEGISAECSLIPGEYPNYRGLIPAQDRVLVEFDDVDQFDQLRRVARIAGHPKLEAVPVVIREGSPIAASIEAKAVDQRIDVDLAGKAHETVAFNVQYLTDTAAGSTSPVIHGVDPLKPAVIRWDDVDGYHHTRLLMPVRVQ